MFVNDQPLAILILKNHSPAEIAHLDLARFGRHLFADGRSRPDQISVRMDGEVIIQRELRALVVDRGLHPVAYSSQLPYFKGAMSKKVCGPLA